MAEKPATKGEAKEKPHDFGELVIAFCGGFLAALAVWALTKKE